MEKEYMELKQFTVSVVDIYLELAKLEKQEKKESQEYENLVSLLPKALEIEKRKYLILENNEHYIASCKEVLNKAERVEDILLVPSKEVLVALRMLNFMDPEMYHSLLGSTSIEVKLHYYIEEIFLRTLVKSIYRVKSSGRGLLIDYASAILASSCTYDFEKFDSIQPTFSLNEQDQMAIHLCLLPKMKELSDKLFSLKDGDLTKDTILSVLYYKALIYFYPYALNLMEEIEHSIQLIEYMNSKPDKKYSKVLNLLSLLKEEENRLSK